MKLKIEDILELPEVHFIRNQRIEHMLYVYVLPSGEFKVDRITGKADSIDLVNMIDVARRYRSLRALGFLTIHNHPTEMATPSILDIECHCYMNLESKKNSIKHIDDLIVDGKGRYCSFREMFSTL